MLGFLGRSRLLVPVVVSPNVQLRYLTGIVHEIAPGPRNCGHLDWRNIVRLVHVTERSFRDEQRTE